VFLCFVGVESLFGPLSGSFVHFIWENPLIRRTQQLRFEGRWCTPKFGQALLIKPSRTASRSTYRPPPTTTTHHPSNSHYSPASTHQPILLPSSFLFSALVLQPRPTYTRLHNTSPLFAARPVPPGLRPAPSKQNHKRNVDPSTLCRANSANKNFNVPSTGRGQVLLYFLATSNTQPSSCV
jgi:hypothetical protein